MGNHKQDKEQEHLNRLQVLFDQKEWEDFKQEVNQVYRNSDNSLHSVGCPNRDIFVGKCEAIKEILAIEEKVEKEIG